MKIDEKEVERLEHVWRNDFAQLYEDRPRLYNLLKSCTLDIGVIEIEPGIDMNVMVFYVQNETLQSWIEEKMLFELQDRFAELAGLETLTLAVDVEPNYNTEDEIL